MNEPFLWNLHLLAIALFAHYYISHRIQSGSDGRFSITFRHLSDDQIEWQSVQ